MKHRLAIALAATGLAVSACQTTGSSSVSTVMGIRSNFQPTHTRLEGTFLETIDLEAAGADQSELTNEDMRALALRDDPTSQRGFFGMVHASMFSDQPSYHHLVGDPGPARYMQTVLERVLTGWDGPAPDIQVVVTADPGLRGAAHQENFITIPIGVLINAESEDEVAALLAHEASHLILGHVGGSNDSRRFERRMNDAMDTLGYYSASMRVTRFRETADGGFETYTIRDAEAEEQLFGVSLATQASREIARNFLFPSMSRELEEHADLMAADLMAGSGHYNPAAMQDLLARTADQQRNTAGEIERLEATQRLQAQLAAERLGVDTSSGFLNRLAFGSAISLYEQVRDRANQSYRSYDNRAENTNEYIERVYLLEWEAPSGASDEDARPPATRDMDRGGLARFLDSPEGAIVSAFEAAFHATALHKQALTLGPSDPDYMDRLNQAEARINEAIAQGGGDESQVRFIEYQILGQLGRNEEAFRALRMAADKPSASAETFEHMARLYIDRRRYEEAEIALDRIVELMATDLVVMPMRLEVALLRGDRETAQDWLDRCQGTDNEVIVNRCNTIAIELGLMEEPQETNVFRALTRGALRN